jgi:hypothetical protein
MFLETGSVLRKKQNEFHLVVPLDYLCKIRSAALQKKKEGSTLTSKYTTVIYSKLNELKFSKFLLKLMLTFSMTLLMTVVKKNN